MRTTNFCKRCGRVLTRSGECLTCPPDPKKCDCCGRDYSRPGDLKGLCPGCCAGLGGGKFSARVVQSEAKAMSRARQGVAHA